MGVVDFYTSRDLGNKERVSCSQRVLLRRISLRSRPLELSQSECHGSPNGSGRCGLSLTTSTYMLPVEVSLCNPIILLKADKTDYLEYKMGTIKLYNGRNNFLNTYFIQIPYYIFLGCSRQRDASAAAKAFEVEAGNTLGQGKGGLLTPNSPFTTSPWPGTPAMEKMMSIVPAEFSLGPSALEQGEGWTQSIRDVGAPLSPFHYQLRKVSYVTNT
jgi:betaine lipid synthase